MKNIIIIFLLMIISLGFANNIDVISSSDSGLELKVLLPDLNLTEEIRDDWQSYKQINLPGSSQLAVGQPDIPAIAHWIILPNEQLPEVQIRLGNKEKFSNVNIAPVQPYQVDLIGSRETPFQAYARDIRNDYLPDRFYNFESIKNIRGVYATILWIYPYQYNPISKELVVYEDLELNISFQGAKEEVKSGLISENFRQMLKRLALNPDMISSNREQRDQNTELLIITDEIFIEAVELLADWKKQRGIQTEIFYTSEIGTTAEEIRSFIQNVYQNWSNVPEYILFFGDSEYIPTWYVNQHPYTDGGQGRTASDLYYIDVSTPTDMVADFNSGRISVDTEEDAINFVEFTIDYEKHPPTQPDFYQNATIAAAFQDGSSDYAPNGMADRRFAKTAEDVQNFLDDQGFSAERIYTTYNGYNNQEIFPEYWNNQSWAVFENDTPGETLPTFLQKPQFPWDGNANDIMNSLNAGSFFLLHRDHGGRTGWGEPDFGSSDVNNLINGNLSPMVWSINCNTGWYDNETDDNECGTSQQSECFVEAWLRNENGGSCGVMGSTRVSYSGINDRLVWGWMDAIWPFFTTQMSDPYGDDIRITEMSSVLNYGKLYMMTKITDDEIRRTALEEFHWYGDPTLRMWTQQPPVLAVTHDNSILIGSTSFSVSTQNNAVVTIMQNGEILAVGEALNGTANLVFEPITSVDDVTLSVNLYNYQHYEATISIAPPDEAYLIAEIEMENFQFGNTYDLNVSLENIGGDNDGNIELILTTENDYVTILNNVADCEEIGANETVFLEESFSVIIDDFVPDQYVVSFELAISSDAGNWNYPFYATLLAPNLFVGNVTVNDASGNSNGILDPGETVQIQLENYNLGHAMSPVANGFLISMNPDVTITNSMDEIGTLEVDAMQIAQFEVMVSEDMEEGESVEFLYNVTAMDYHAEKSFELLVGLTVEDFETGNFLSFPWEFDGNEEWTIDSEEFHQGQYSAKSGSIGSDQHSSLVIEFEALTGGVLQFQKKVSSEYGYDFFGFYIDDILQNQWSGEVDWSEEMYYISEGIHVLEWRYTKDGYVEEGEDCAYVDYIIFPSFHVVLPPLLTIEPENGFSLDMITDEVTSDTLFISNIGGGEINYMLGLLPSEDTKDLTGSEIICSQDTFVPGTILPLVLQAHNNGDECISKIQLSVPTDFIVSGATNLVGGSYNLYPAIGYGDITEIVWSNSTVQDALEPGDIATCAISIEPSLTADENVAIGYEMFGVGENGTPHTVSGTIILHNQDQVFSTISFSENGGFLDENETNEIEVTFDATGTDNGTYLYDIVVVTDYTDFQYIPIVMEVSGSGSSVVTVPEKTGLIGNHPNPFNPETSIQFMLAKDESVELNIYNIKGQKVATLVDQNLEAGNHSIVWSGIDTLNRKVGSGIYFYQLKTSNTDQIRKMILMK